MAEEVHQRDGLCEFCSCIEFETLSLPTRADLRLLSEGQSPRKRGLYDDANNPNTYMWSLGLQSRVNESATACRLCNAICLLLQGRGTAVPHGLEEALCIAEVSVVGNLRPPKGEKWSLGKYVRLRRLSLRWRKVQENETIEPGHLSSRGEKRYGAEFQLPQCFQTCRVGLGQEMSPLDHADFVFGGRPVPSLINPETVLGWLRRCQKDHSNLCNGQIGSW